MPASILPTRSAPTSAAFVNIPPPTLANNAWELAPIPKHGSIMAISSNETLVNLRNTKNHKEMSKSPIPTTISPITAPLLNATWSPWFRDFLAPSAVLELALVAVFIPRKPASPDRKPLVKNAKGTTFDWECSPKEIKRRTRNAPIKNIPTTLYCCRR